MQKLNALFLEQLASTSERVHGDEEGFQTAEAIGIAAVGFLVLFAVWGALEALGVDVIDWIRGQFGVGSTP